VNKIPMRVVLASFLAAALPACAAAPHVPAGSPVETNKTVARRLFEEAENRGDWELFSRLHAEDAVVHAPAGDFGLREEVENERALRKASADAKFTVDQVLAEGNMVMVRYVVRATVTGSLWGLPATGKAVAVPGVTILRMANGKIAEKWSHDDVLGMLEQAGLVAPWCAAQR
jgi:steroid delta-isomerase-like uncharacterized protein